jgi:hypothetical protein
VPDAALSGQCRGPERTTPPVVLPCGCTFPGRTIAGGALGDYAGNHGDLSPGSNGRPTDFYWGGYGTGVIISSRGVCEGDRPVSRYDRVRLADVVDGSSNTFLAGELHVPRGRLGQSPENGPVYDGTTFFSMSRVSGPGVPLARGPDDDLLGMETYAFGSWHPGVCRFAFCDGRVAAVNTTVSTTTMERLCHRADGMVVPEY